jgi:peroxiredoxin
VEELPHLQGLQAGLNKKGVQILGFNCSDDGTLAARFLKEKGISFPTILDSSPEAVKVCFRQYGAQGVPVHYLISNGWVVDAWVGFEADHRRLFEALEKLGVNQR